MKPLILVLSIVFLAGCKNGNGGTTGGNPYTEDTSASGAVAQAIGGALSYSSSSGLQAMYKPQSRMVAKNSLLDFSLWPKAWAAAICPTFLSTGSSCAAAGSTMVLDYDYCQFASSQVVFKGKQALKMSTGSAQCGQFPNPGASQSLYRQFVSNNLATAPSVMYMTSGYGTLAAVDHVTADLSNFDNQTISTIINSGYGMKVDFNASGLRSAITLKERVVVVSSYDHTIDASLSISEGTGSRSVSGTVKVYLNHVKVVGTSTLSGIVHTDQCCVPTSGTITTAFAAGANVAPTAIGALIAGHSESLTFTGCGTATHTAYDGTVTQVSLSRCF